MPSRARGPHARMFPRRGPKLWVVLVRAWETGQVGGYNPPHLDVDWAAFEKPRAAGMLLAAGGPGWSEFQGESRGCGAAVPWGELGSSSLVSLDRPWVVLKGG